MGQQLSSFASRGGWWIVAQVPVMIGAFFVPLVTGVERLNWSAPAQVGGMVVTVVAGVMILGGLFGLGRDLTPFPRPLAHGRLHQRGAYRIVRHPIYAGVILGSFGWSLAWLSVGGALFGLFVFLFFDRKSRFEEAFLRARFPEYSTYAARVRRFIPGVY
jgi:protein-S-isoprenylcysteine O-methyltransferase Ste14